MTMDLLVQIAQVLALIGLTALCVALIMTLSRLSSTLSTIERELTEISSVAKPVLKNLDIVAEKAKTIATHIEVQIGHVTGTLVTLRKAAENVLEFEKRIEQAIESPIVRIVSKINEFFGTFSGILGIFKNLRRNRPSQ